MKISTRGRYGLRAVLELASRKGKRTALGEIAQKQSLSLNYLESIFSQLRRAGLVVGVTGSQGGYYLAKEPEEISAGEVLEALEKDLSVTQEHEEMLPLRAYLTEQVWKKMDRGVEAVLYSYKISDLLENPALNAEVPGLRCKEGSGFVNGRSNPVS